MKDKSSEATNFNPSLGRSIYNLNFFSSLYTLILFVLHLLKQIILYSYVSP